MLKVFALAAAVLVSLPALSQTGATGSAQSQKALAQQLRDTIAIFRQTPPDSSDLDNVADDLDDIVEQIVPAKLDAKTLQQLIALLDLPGHPEVGQLTLMLQHFGSRARPAAPKLIAMLPLYDCPPPGFSSGISIGDTIRTTLRRIGVKPPAKHCR